MESETDERKMMEGWYPKSQIWVLVVLAVTHEAEGGHEKESYFRRIYEMLPSFGQDEKSWQSFFLKTHLSFFVRDGMYRSEANAPQFCCCCSQSFNCC